MFKVLSSLVGYRRPSDRQVTARRQMQSVRKGLGCEQCEPRLMCAGLTPIDDDAPFTVVELQVGQKDLTNSPINYGVKRLSTAVVQGLTQIEDALLTLIAESQIETNYVDDVFASAGVRRQIDRTIPNEMPVDTRLKALTERWQRAFDSSTFDVVAGTADLVDVDLRTRTKSIDLSGLNTNNLDYLDMVVLQGQGHAKSTLESTIHYVVANDGVAIDIDTSSLVFTIALFGGLDGKGAIGELENVKLDAHYRADVWARLVLSDLNHDGKATADEIAGSRFVWTANETLNTTYTVTLGGLDEKIRWSTITTMMTNDQAPGATVSSEMRLPTQEQFEAAANRGIPEAFSKLVNVKPVRSSMNNPSAPVVDAVSDILPVRGRVATSAERKLAASNAAGTAEMQQFVHGQQAHLVHWSINLDEEVFDWEKTITLASVNVWIVSVSLQATIEASLSVGIHASGWIDTRGLTLDPGSEVKLDGSAEVGLQGEASVVGLSVARVRGTVGVDLGLSLIVVNPEGGDDVPFEYIRRSPRTYLTGDLDIDLFVQVRVWFLGYQVWQKKWNLVNFADKHWGAAPQSSQRLWAAQVDAALVPAPDNDDDDRPLMLPVNEGLEDELFEMA